MQAAVKDIMDALFRFLVKYEILVYLLLLLGAVFAVRATWMAWAQWRASVYGLEKEISFQRLRVSGATVILLLMIGLSQFCLVSFVVPFLPATTFLPTPTADLLQTPVPALAEGAATPAAGTELPPPGTTGCIPGALIISSPAPGQEISGQITLTGTVDVPNFGFFKYEFSPLGTEQWATIAAGDKVVINSDLGLWDTTALTPGDYQLRLVVTDNLGKALPACDVPVRIVAP